MIKNPKNYSHPFSAALVENIKRIQAETRERSRIYEDTKQIVERALKPDVSDFAAKVLLAAAKRRGEVVDSAPRFSDDEHGRFARAVVNAGRRRRGEKEIS